MEKAKRDVKDLRTAKGDNITINEKVELLREHAEMFGQLKKSKMKSKVQTYDIRDSESYKGIYEMEVVLKKRSKDTKIDAEISRLLGKKFNAK